MPVTRENLAEVLEEIALLLELKAENPFKIRAYRQGAEAVRAFDGDIVQRAADNELAGIKGIGDALRDKLHELASTGTLQFHQKLRAEFPAGLFELFDLQGIGPKKIKVLHETLGVGSIADLKALCEGGTVAKLPGFGEKTQAKILEAIALRSSVADTFLMGSVNPLVEEILELLRMHPEVTRVAVAGSFRRGKETVHDVDFLVATKEPATKASIRLKSGIQADLRAVSNKQFPFALQYFTGSKEHNVAIRSLALKKGLSLNEYGFTPVNPEAPAAIPEVNEEADIYQALGLQFIPPELRENRGEIEAATDQALPRLIQLENLRGTFHNHTTASDGHNTLEEMAEEAMDLGLQYLGIADHSKSSFQANGLDEIRLLEQVGKIREMNAGWEHFRLFSGTEVDILKDGSLDFDDSILAQLDYCVASVHSVFNLDEEEMTRRICRAMENEHVTMLGHVTGRLLLRRDEYKVNHAKIIDCAVATRTIIELNCSPKRMDMDWRWWRKARDQGVLCSINPDAHSTARIHHIGLGIRIARKGWLRREDVLNTRPVKEVEAFLKTPKSKR
ncbi:MAG: histidinol-phosphatase [Verrucomicrobiaceae bacterium]|nr:MAG: histidinol-phosphatase [Verrucomicrobiaceae bacterium]